MDSCFNTVVVDITLSSRYGACDERKELDGVRKSMKKSKNILAT